MQTLTKDIKQIEFYLKNDMIDEASKYLGNFKPDYNNKILVRLSAVNQAKILEHECI